MAIAIFFALVCVWLLILYVTVRNLCRFALKALRDPKDDRPYMPEYVVDVQHLPYYLDNHRQQPE